MKIWACNHRDRGFEEYLIQVFPSKQWRRSIPKGVYDNGYNIISFDVVSLFTNVPLGETVDAILERIYKDKVIQTNLKKRALKKLKTPNRAWEYKIYQKQTTGEL